MKYTLLGNSNISISAVALGCMSFGDRKSGFNQWALDAADSERIIKHALDLGITYFDTANAYSAGTSEIYLGQALKRNAARDKVVIQTKVYYNDGKLSRKAILHEIDGSLKRLQTDYIDSYVIHRFDYETPMEETLEALNDLIKVGKVRTIGASAMYAYQFHNFQLMAQNHGWASFSSMQSQYNLLYREDEREMNPVSKQYDVALTPYSPLAAGRLARVSSESQRAKTDNIAKEKFDNVYSQEADRKIVMRVHELAEQKNVTMSTVALAWLYAKGVSAPIVGATKDKHLDETVEASSLSLTTDELTYLEEPYLPHKIVGAK